MRADGKATMMAPQAKRHYGLPTIHGGRLAPEVGDVVQASDGRDYVITRRKRTRIEAYELGHPARFQMLEVIPTCVKVRYPTKQAADDVLVLSKIKRSLRGSQKRREESSYWCDDCEAWHLTSQKRF